MPNTSLPPDLTADAEAALSAVARLKAAVVRHRGTSVHGRIMNHLDTAERSLRSLEPLLAHWTAEVCVGAPLVVE
jgi:hypothetical protein